MAVESTELAASEFSRPTRTKMGGAQREIDKLPGPDTMSNTKHQPGGNNMKDQELLKRWKNAN